MDLPVSGPALAVASLARLAVPVILGAAAGAWLLSRRRLGDLVAELAAELPPWRPLPALALHLAAFGGTAALAWALLGPGAAPPSSPALAGLLALGALAALLALATAAPLAWCARRSVGRWRGPVLALALGLVAWRAAAAAEALWGLLTSSTLRGVAGLLRLVADGVVVIPEEQAVGLRGFEVEVAPICSGVDGIGLVLLFQAVWLALSRSRLRLRRALLVLPVGALAAFAANVVRIAALVLAGASGHERLAMGGLHSKLGWVLFTAIALASVAAGERIDWFRRGGAPPDAEEALPREAAAYLAPLLAAVAAALLSGIWADGPLDRAYALRLLAAVLALLLVRRDLPRPALTLSWLPLITGLAVAAIWVAAPGGDPAPLAGRLAELSQAERVTWITLRLLGSVLLVPVVEELAFRGFLLSWLASRRGELAGAPSWSWPAIAISSLAFGTLHGSWLLGALAGSAFAAVMLLTRRLAAAVLAHAVANLGVAAAVLLGGRWDLWS